MCKAMYIHVPFCRDICAYCDFMRCRYHEILAEKWLNAVSNDLKNRCRTAMFETIYIGGGTPSALTYEQLKELLSLIQPYCDYVQEYTMEANVDSFDEAKIALCVQAGIHRVSLGVQSLQDDILKRIDRNHNVQDIQTCIAMLHTHGIHNISVDMMYGLPGQTMAMWMADLQQLVQAFDITHISLYALTIEEHSRFGREHVAPCDANLEADMYEYAISYLEEHGFIRYEISNFAKPGFQSQHNQVYWNYEDFIGIGCGASGKQHHQRYDNTSNLETYFHDGASPDITYLDQEDEMFEMIMMSLRLTKGLARSHFQEWFACDVDDVYHDVILLHQSTGNLVLNETYLYATSQGLMILNDILVDFLPVKDGAKR